MEYQQQVQTEVETGTQLPAMNVKPDANRRSDSERKLMKIAALAENSVPTIQLKTLQDQMNAYTPKKGVMGNFGDEVVQRAMDPFSDDGYEEVEGMDDINDFSGDNVENDVENEGNQARTGSSTASTVYLSDTQGQTNAADLDEMDTMRDIYVTDQDEDDEDFDIRLLGDPSRQNPETVLTRMHIINGRLFGPSDSSNMVLGTSAANNWHEESHLHEVEQPIRDFIEADPANHRVIYTVVPIFDGPPDYMRYRLGLMEDDEEGAEEWTEQGLPTILHCSATFFRDNDGTIESKDEEEGIQMDLTGD